MSEARLDILDRLMLAYNAGDAERYASFFAEDGVEAMYLGDELRVGRAGVREGNARTFAEFPQNRAEVLDRKVFGDRVAVHEKVWREPDGEPFEVLALYSFDRDEVSRVEFVR